MQRHGLIASLERTCRKLAVDTYLEEHIYHIWKSALDDWKRITIADVQGKGLMAAQNTRASKNIQVIWKETLKHSLLGK